MAMKRQFPLDDLEFIEFSCGQPLCQTAVRLTLKGLQTPREVACPQCGTALCDTRQLNDSVARLLHAIDELTGLARIERSRIALGFRK